MAPRIGLIGIIGKELQADPWGTLDRVSQIGYRGLESIAGVGSRSGVSMAELKARLDALGLASVAQGGVFLQGNDEKLDRAIGAAQAMGAKYVVSYWGPCESKDGVLKLAEALNQLGARCRAGGVTFCYHNHNHEFAQFDGEYGLDILAASTDPRNVKLELDVAWVTYGGADPVTVMRRHAGRCPILHVKDFVAVPEGGATADSGRTGAQFTEVGTGVVNIKGVAAAAAGAGVEWLVVEQDQLRDLPAMESIRVSYENVERALK